MTPPTGPLSSLDQWEDDLRRRYPEHGPTPESKKFRDYAAASRSCVKEFYRLNHRHQTVDFVRAKRAQFLPPRRMAMGVWEAMEYLNNLVDDSDPDIDLPQIEHLLQTAESCRRDGRPRWFILTGLIHDLGKILCLWGEPQWAVVGDTFPVGCAYRPSVVFAEFFADNPDADVPEYQTPLGIYPRGGGLDGVLMSWGHDEYLYHVVQPYLPEPALYMIRYHSFYAAHREGAYDELMNDRDREMFRWVRQFNPYDLYTKSSTRVDVAALRPFYEELIAEFFPARIAW